MIAARTSTWAPPPSASRGLSREAGEIDIIQYDMIELCIYIYICIYV